MILASCGGRSFKKLISNSIGGKHFSKNLRPLNADGEVESMWAVRIYSLPSLYHTHPCMT